MEIDINNYDIDGIKEYFNAMKKDQESYYGTAYTNGFPLAMVDLIDVDSEYNISGLSDYEIIIKAKNMGILENFYLGKRY